ncbi:hypothetical protein [Lachnoclostridium phytofermentans]|nr:hypothetical protein [Lachnoclostridium phytofermentans]
MAGTAIFSAFSFIGLLLYLMGIFSFVLFIIVLIKLNKALNIWLEQNKRY